MLKKIKLYIMLYLEVRNMKRAIANSSLSDLRFAPQVIEALLTEGRNLHPSVIDVWERELVEAFVAKSMLLVTGIEDVMMLSDRISMIAMRNGLFKAYGMRIRDLGNILFPEGKDSYSSPFPFFPHGISSSETHNHPDPTSSKCFVCESLPFYPNPEANHIRNLMGMDAMNSGDIHKPSAITIDGDTEEEILQQLETHLLQHLCTDGNLDKVKINDMPAELFTLMNIEKFSQQFRETFLGVIVTS